ncbi:endolytic transglycosylase MltG [Gracilibacillus thailandensis]|uniref:Endolytic murein transglycosylase n=1 Tax=Gracilibacillus thailandensis TaxID=563735 RepID=A0A6N7QZP8_9BACI|nr:endolytic transglycosylase MltG [Gracilibacillus thailandensis]MRI66311.1 endolytic transglycosylase MltG [Gracilibacillus thailandensis]
MSNDKSKEKEEKNNKSKKKLTYKEISQERAKEASVARRIILIVFIVLTAVIIIGGFSGYKYVKKGLTPVDPDSDETVNVTIPLGSSSSDIANILEDEGIISNSLIYRFYVKFNNAADFQAGDYSLSPSMTLAEVTEELGTGSLQQEAQLRVTVPEGRNIEEIASIYQEHAGIDSEEFLEKMTDQSYIEGLIEQYPNVLTEEILAEDIIYPLEGYLFPATYAFYTDEPTIDDIITQMLNKTNDVVVAYYDQIDALDLSIHEVITFASLVEEEAPSEEDRREIAGVFNNRLKEGMKLQTDPTVIYAHGEHISRLTYDHYEIDSPYNTYQVQGLPVGPIANFGESSLSAVLDPEENNYLYFLADSDGNVHYSTTYEEHQNLEDEYIHNEE